MAVLTGGVVMSWTTLFVHSNYNGQFYVSILKIMLKGFVKNNPEHSAKTHTYIYMTLKMGIHA
jgi:hypothetical protein